MFHIIAEEVGGPTEDPRKETFNGCNILHGGKTATKKGAGSSQG
jgi:hypothetical protein